MQTVILSSLTAYPLRLNPMSDTVESTKNRIIQTLDQTGWHSFGRETKLAWAGGSRTFGDVILSLVNTGVVEQREQAADQLVEYRLVRAELPQASPGLPR